MLLQAVALGADLAVVDRVVAAQDWLATHHALVGLRNIVLLWWSEITTTSVGKRHAGKVGDADTIIRD